MSFYIKENGSKVCFLNIFVRVKQLLGIKFSILFIFIRNYWIKPLQWRIKCGGSGDTPPPGPSRSNFFNFHFRQKYYLIIDLVWEILDSPVKY